MESREVRCRPSGTARSEARAAGRLVGEKCWVAAWRPALGRGRSLGKRPHRAEQLSSLAEPRPSSPGSRGASRAPELVRKLGEQSREPVLRVALGV